ncbi:MAG: hypothetical protein HGA28_08260 [Anaerolineaceae bacterium]|nr:hypothetical protein [Anaerolineaceae bacterium]
MQPGQRLQEIDWENVNGTINGSIFELANSLRLRAPPRKASGVAQHPSLGIPGETSGRGEAKWDGFWQAWTVLECSINPKPASPGARSGGGGMKIPQIGRASDFSKQDETIGR